MIMNIRTGIALLGVSLLALVASSQTKADPSDQATLFTFSSVIRVPGQVLPAGAYWFVLLDHGAYPETVQIFRADDMALVTSIQTISVDRAEPTGATEITLAEPSDSYRGIPAITEWFYPGDEVGHEFIYSSQRERELQREREQELRMPDAREPGAARPTVTVP
jgi:hypothetical protein